MSLNILKILSFLSILVFLAIMLLSEGNRNRAFVFFILTAFPFLNIATVENFNGFEIITFLFYFIFYKKREVEFNGLVFYRIMLILLTITIAVGLIAAEERVNQANLIEFIRLYPVFIFSYILINECLHDEKFMKTVLNCIKITLIFSFVFLCLQFIFGVGFSLSRTMNSNIVSSSGIRYNSFMIDPQVYSQFLGAASFLCILNLDKKTTGVSKFSYLISSLAVICILIAGGRAGLIGWALGLVLIISFSNNLNRIIMIVCGTGLYFLAMNFKDKLVIFNRSTDMNDTYEFRASVWNDAYQIFLDHPYTGIGLNNYAEYVSVHNPDQVWLIDNEFIPFDHPENGYLKYLTEMGGIGFLLLFSFILIPVVLSGISYLRKKDNNYIILFASLICWLAGFYSTFSFGDTRMKILVGSIISIMIAYQQVQKQTAEEITDTDNEEQTETMIAT